MFTPWTAYLVPMNMAIMQSMLLIACAWMPGPSSADNNPQPSSAHGEWRVVRIPGSNVIRIRRMSAHHANRAHALHHGQAATNVVRLDRNSPSRKRAV
jgi:hypothetical protein